MGKRNDRRRLLSSHVEAIEYVHADDGRPYRHDFIRGDSRIELARDGSVVIRNPRARLWGDYAGQPFLENPPTGTPAMRHRKSRKRSRSRARHAHNAPRRRRRRRHAVALVPSVRASNPRRRRHRAASAPRRRSSRRRYGNPPTFSPRNLMNTLIDGAIHGAEVLGGEIVVGTAQKLTASDPLTAQGAGVGLLAAMAAGLGLSMLGQGDAGRYALAGGVAQVARPWIRRLAIPYVSDSLAGYDTVVTYPIADGDRRLTSGGETSRFAGYAPRLAAPATPPTSPFVLFQS